MFKFFQFFSIFLLIFFDFYFLSLKFIGFWLTLTGASQQMRPVAHRLPEPVRVTQSGARRTGIPFEGSLPCAHGLLSV